MGHYTSYILKPLHPWQRLTLLSIMLGWINASDNAVKAEGCNSQEGMVFGNFALADAAVNPPLLILNYPGPKSTDSLYTSSSSTKVSQLLHYHYVSCVLPA